MCKDQTDADRPTDASGLPKLPPTPPRCLIRAAAIATVGTAGILAAVLLLVNRSEWWRGFLAATVVSALSAAGSVPPLVWGLNRSVTQAAAGFFLAAGVKMIISIGGGVMAVLVGGYPPMATMLLIVVYYLVLLAVESTLVAKSLWSANA